MGSEDLLGCGADIDDVILGQASPNGEAPAIGRIASTNGGTALPANPTTNRPSPSSATDAATGRWPLGLPSGLKPEQRPPALRGWLHNHDLSTDPRPRRGNNR
jgi:hypothetical protein